MARSSPLPSEIAEAVPAAIAEALARGATILTGNQRAARSLRHGFDLDRQAAGLLRWEPPAIFAWETWAASLWHRLLVEGHATQLLLNAPQEHSLWRAIIADDPEWQSLVPPDALAELAAQAWSRLCAYRGEGRLRPSASSVDTRAFVRWAQLFTTRCRAEELLPQAQLESALAASPLPELSGGLLLVGFDRLTPAQEALLTAIRKLGVTVAELAPGDPVEGQLLEAPDPKAELLAAARALREHLQEHPTHRAALIVPDLAGQRAELDRVLRQTLAPEDNTITSTNPPPFEFSLGVPLSETPLAAAALDLLRWAHDALPLPRIGQLLLSPYVGDGHDLPGRAAFDAYQLRRHRPLRPELTLERFLPLAEGAKRQPPRELLATLHAFGRAITGAALADSRSYADWADTFRAFLAAAGWGKGLDSAGFQTLDKWENTLDELSTLDFTGVRVAYTEAVASLERLCGRTLFAPETRNAPVQVMGPLESAGSTFDAVWFAGAGDATWPQRPSTSPLLSWHLQRELGMPGTDPDRDLAAARHTARRLAASASSVTFSYTRELSNTRQRPSPALAGLALASAETASAPPPPEPLLLESIDDANTVPAPPDQILQGGAEILKLQAACGFRAFAERRLYARALDASEPGMNARDRGTVVHKILQSFWSRVHTQDALRDLTQDARRALLTEAIETALSTPARENVGEWSGAYLDVQCERLLTVLDSWLLKELDRKVPFLVRAEELRLDEVRIGPLRLTLQVDRIDETEFGDVILDYKTGDASPAHWLTDRPDEPQLPLYAVVASNPVAGVAFANIRAGKDMALQGYQTQTGLLLHDAKLKTATLDDQIDAWRDTLTTLAEDFHRGDLRVRPKAYPHTCQFCQQRLLCRLDITLLQAADDEEEAAGEDRG